MFIDVPDNVEDCEVTVLTSGWPTTSAYPPEHPGDACLFEAAAAGTPAQRTLWGRDDRGGIEGTILRVTGPDSVLKISYVVSPDGAVTSREETCSTLAIGDSEPPSC